MELKLQENLRVSNDELNLMAEEANVKISLRWMEISKRDFNCTGV